MKKEWVMPQANDVAIVSVTEGGRVSGPSDGLTAKTS